MSSASASSQRYPPPSGHQSLLVQIVQEPQLSTTFEVTPGRTTFDGFFADPDSDDKAATYIDPSTLDYLNTVRGALEADWEAIRSKQGELERKEVDLQKRETLVGIILQEEEEKARGVRDKIQRLEDSLFFYQDRSTAWEELARSRGEDLELLKEQAEELKGEVAELRDELRVAKVALKAKRQHIRPLREERQRQDVKPQSGEASPSDQRRVDADGTFNRPLMIDDDSD